MRNEEIVKCPHCGKPLDMQTMLMAHKAIQQGYGATGGKAGTEVQRDAHRKAIAKTNARLTHESRSESARKAWETRRRKAEGKH